VKGFRNHFFIEPSGDKTRGSRLFFSSFAFAPYALLHDFVVKMPGTLYVFYGEGKCDI
jgi:hypothetical protein